MCLYAMLPASESRCSISFPVRIPPVVFVYASSRSGEEEKGSVSEQYESHMCRGVRESCAGEEEKEGGDVVQAAVGVRVSDHFVSDFIGRRLDSSLKSQNIAVDG